MRILYRLKDCWEFIRYEPIYFVQRLFRGYSDRDLWNLDYTLGEIIVKHLKAFRNIKQMGYPSSFKDKEEWTKTLDDMIYGIDYLTHHDEKSFKIWEECGCRMSFKGNTLEHEEGDFETYHKRCKEEYEDAKKKSMLFIEYFNSLWD